MSIIKYKSRLRVREGRAFFWGCAAFSVFNKDTGDGGAVVTRRTIICSCTVSSFLFSPFVPSLPRRFGRIRRRLPRSRSPRGDIKFIGCENYKMRRFPHRVLPVELSFPGLCPPTQYAHTRPFKFYHHPRAHRV